jgi:hypothetical protein
MLSMVISRSAVALHLIDISGHASGGTESLRHHPTRTPEPASAIRADPDRRRPPLYAGSSNRILGLAPSREAR